MAKGLISGELFEPTKIAIVDIQHTNFSYILLVNEELKDFDYLYEYAGGVKWYSRDELDNYDAILKSIKNLFGDIPIVYIKYRTDYLEEHKEDLDAMSVLLFGEDLSERHCSEIKKDINVLLSRWFCALEDEGVDPWQDEDCMAMAKKYRYTKEDYRKFSTSLS